MDNIQAICRKCRNASYGLAIADNDTKNTILLSIADQLELSEQDILQANLIDLQQATMLSKSMQDRLMLNSARIKAMADGIRQVANLDDPIGKIVDQWSRPNGLVIEKVMAPLGVVGVIYEARPNVTIDVAGLCIKSGNCVILRGGKEAVNSNRALYNVVKKAIEKVGFDSDIVGFIDDISRESTLQLLKQGDSVDVVIPRGGDGLKKFVLENATMPVIASAGGNCHIYVEESGDFTKALAIIHNAKMSRPSVCNACEQLLVDKSIAEKFIPQVVEFLGKDGCKFNGCKQAVAISNSIELADEQQYFTEHLDYVLTICVVDDYMQAIDRINRYNTQHSEAIISNNQVAIDMFRRKVDAGCVYVNASTRFTDGFEFGFGAEIGISTQKLHARGPLGLQQLTSQKYIINGQGQIR